LIPTPAVLRSAAAGALLCLCACSGGPSAPEFREARAWSFLVRQISFGPRFAGAPGSARQLAWLREQLATSADTVLLQPFSAPGEDGRALACTSVVARVRPAARERVLFVANRDTRRRAEGSLAPRDQRRPVPGANLNASGMAVLLEMAQLFREQPPPVGVDLLFADCDDYSGESAFAGTRHFLRSQPGYRARYAVVVQAVGDYDARFPMDAASAPAAAARVWSAARRLGYDSLFVPEAGRPRPSAAPLLAAAGVPPVVVRDPEYGPAEVRWHGVDDLPQYLRRETLGAVGRTLVAALYAEPPAPEP
jgi:glutaminyl-peptide cyclotransferase